MHFEESIIPKEVWDFVKKILKNPMAQGILAMMIYNYIRNKNTTDNIKLETYSERLERLDKSLSPRNSEEENEQIRKEVRDFIARINKYAMKPIDINKVEKNGQMRWLSEQIKYEQDNAIWKNLSTDKQSAKHFKTEPQDATEGTFFVDVDFLTRKAGNATGMLGKEDSIRQAFEKNVKLPTPQYWLSDNELGEGNHRVMVAKEFGLRSVPVRIYWK